jgi:hypothetical protein
MQHNFGMPTHFLTVTPDDDNSILLQVYSHIDIDINTSATDEKDSAEIEKNARKRTELRIKYPGIAATIFEDILHVVIETVIGWDLKTGKPKIGLYGTPLALSSTIEEQGIEHYTLIFRSGSKKYMRHVRACFLKEEMSDEMRKSRCVKKPIVLCQILFCLKHVMLVLDIYSRFHMTAVSEQIDEDILRQLTTRHYAT